MKNLAKLRKAAGFTQTTFAEALGVSQTAVGSWENGEKHPTSDKLPIIAQMLGCTIDALYAEESA